MVFGQSGNSTMSGTLKDPSDAPIPGGSGGSITSAFEAPAQFTFGNSPRSVLRGAPLVTTDLTLEKAFQWTEELKLDLRAEFYNLLNKANFNLPGLTYGAADFGVVTSARSGRTVQLAARISF
jgi:hypothetical protein